MHDHPEPLANAKAAPPSEARHMGVAQLVGSPLCLFGSCHVQRLTMSTLTDLPMGTSLSIPHGTYLVPCSVRLKIWGVSRPSQA